MQLNPRRVKELLIEKGITHLYHANTVTTSCTFIKEGGLLSRGAVRDAGLAQTSQSSDRIDQLHDVWYDIFLDSNDLHRRFNKQNYYGPVLFKFSLDILDDDSIPPLWITTTNPIYWEDNDTNQEKYFQSIREFDQNYVNGAYRQMITLRDTIDPLPFDPYLEEIILDDPKLKLNNVNLYQAAKKALDEAAQSNDYISENVRIRRRKCVNCWCATNYFNLEESALWKAFTL